MDTAENMGQNVGSKIDEGKEQVRRYASKAKEMASDYAAQAQQYAGQAKDVTEEQIKQNPFISMLVALGVGVTLGMVLSAAFSSRDE